MALVLATACGFLLAFFVFHCTWVAASVSTPSAFLTATEPDGSVTVYDDYRQAYKWLAANTSADARVLSWWDYG
jgi:dolichyl-diphosphooligosaccharide--protein glycosyltransferase